MYRWCFHLIRLKQGVESMTEKVLWPNIDWGACDKMEGYFYCSVCGISLPRDTLNECERQ